MAHSPYNELAALAEQIDYALDENYHERRDVNADMVKWVEEIRQLRMALQKFTSDTEPSLAQEHGLGVNQLV
jgi:hypothetical protein